MKAREQDIIDEIHRRRAELLAKYGNDLQQYAAHLRERENSHPERVVDQVTVVSSTSKR